MSKSALTIPEAADYLRVSLNTIRRWVKDGTLPAYRPAGCVQLIRIDREALEALKVPVVAK